MFLKRVLVMMGGILLFIGAFLLKFHLSDAHLENVFQQERVKYGVDHTVLTLPEAAPPPLPVPVTPVSTAPAPAPSTSDNETPAPGTTTDTNVIIGPVPPKPDETPAPSSTPDTTAPAPAPDTNGGPMAPSTMYFPRTHHSSFLASVAVILHTAATEAGESTKGETSEETNSAATSETTNAAAPETNAARPATNASSAATNETSSAPAPRAAASGGRAIVLGYHQFTGPGVSSRNIYSMSQDVFESEMKYLHDNGYNVVPLSNVVRFVEHKGSLPPNAVAITIDDGYKSALVYAAPVLKKYGYPWTYFVYPEFITETEGKGAASWPDLIELDKEGVDVECHSMTHPQLSKKTQKFHGSRHLLSPDEYDQFLTSETSGAKEILEQRLGKKIKYFAYPYGDYNKAVEAKVIAAGFEAVFTVADNPVHVTTNIYSIGRYIITRPVERAFAGYLRQGALSLAEVDPSPGATTSNPRPVITAVLGFNGDPKSLETEVRDFGVVRHDFNPQTSTIRLYLPRDLIQPDVMVSIRAKDAQSGQSMVANWHFNYEPSGAAPVTHEPIPAATNASASVAPAPTASRIDSALAAPIPAVPANPPAADTNTSSTPAPSSPAEDTNAPAAPAPTTP